MRKMRRILIALLCGCILAGCTGCAAGGAGNAGGQSGGEAPAEETQAEGTQAEDAQTGEAADAVGAGEEESEVDAQNRAMLAQALGVPEDQRNIRFLLGALETVEAGQIRSAELTEADGAEVLRVVGEDGTQLDIYLTGSGKVEGVKNPETGEWLITSER